MAGRAFVGRWALRLLPVSLIAAGIAVFMGLKATEPELTPEPVTEKVWSVRTAPAIAATIQPELLFYGQIVAGREVELRPLVPGRVVEVAPNFHEGGMVGEGETLIAIDRFDYDAALAMAVADLAEARARLAELETDLETSKAILEREKSQSTLRQRDADRYANLSKRGAVSSKAYDDARIALLNATERVVEREFGIKRWEATYNRQQAVIQRLEVKVAQAKRELADATLIAPFGGYLADIDTQVGKKIGTNDRVARLIDADRLEVRFHVGSQLFGELLQAGSPIGREAAIAWRLQGEPLRFRAEVARVGAEIDAQSGGVDLYAEILAAPGEDDRVLALLRPGAFVEVRLLGPVYSDVIRLPDTAWHNDRVFVILDGRLVAQSARLVNRIGQDVLVKGDFATGAEILVTPIPAVSEGTRVKPVASAVADAADTDSGA